MLTRPSRVNSLAIRLFLGRLGLNEREEPMHTHVNLSMDDIVRTITVVACKELLITALIDGRVGA